MNNRIDAIYARQSVDKKDSISIESQIEFCKYELKGGNCKEYTDKGYSGKNTDRPKFQELVRDIKRGLIAKVVVYKLDRISRSILDFANMMELFQLSAFCRFLLRREYRGEVFQRDFLSLKSHDFCFLFVSDSGTYKITFPFHAAASAVSVPPVYPAGYGQPAAVNCPVRFSALPVPSYLSSCLFRWLWLWFPTVHFPLTGH